MNGSEALPLASLKSLCGKRLRAVARILFEHGGRVDPGDGPLELYLDDGTVVLFDGSADGEGLRFQFAPWVDPFEPPISEENRVYIEQSGKWIRVGQSSDPMFVGMIGEIICSVAMLENEFGRVSGVRISAGVKDFWFVVAGDECHVHWTRPTGFSESAGSTR